MGWNSQCGLRIEGGCGGDNLKGVRTAVKWWGGAGDRRGSGRSYRAAVSCGRSARWSERGKTHEARCGSGGRVGGGDVGLRGVRVAGVSGVVAVGADDAG